MSKLTDNTTREDRMTVSTSVGKLFLWCSPPECLYLSWETFPLVLTSRMSLPRSGNFPFGAHLRTVSISVGKLFLWCSPPDCLYLRRETFLLVHTSTTATFHIHKYTIANIALTTNPIPHGGGGGRGGCSYMFYAVVSWACHGNDYTSC